MLVDERRTFDVVNHAVHVSNCDFNHLAVNVTAYYACWFAFLCNLQSNRTDMASYI